MASSRTSRRDELLSMFAPGTRHQIRHRPDDPNVIRYNLTWSFGTFALSGGMVLMGLVFLGIGFGLSRVKPMVRQHGPPDIEAEDREIERERQFTEAKKRFRG
jgi:hypothetical protein